MQRKDEKLSLVCIRSVSILFVTLVARVLKSKKRKFHTKIFAHIKNKYYNNLYYNYIIKII